MILELISAIEIQVAYYNTLLELIETQKILEIHYQNQQKNK